MMNCPQCNHQYKGGICPVCGCKPWEYNKQMQQQAAVNAPPPINFNAQQTQGGIHCPKCGSSNLQAISDVQGKGASFWKLCFCGLLGLCGTGKTKTTHYWVCGNCGNKFKM